MATQKDVAEFIGITDRTLRKWATTPGFPRAKGAKGLDLKAVVRWHLDYLERQKKAGKLKAADVDRELKVE